MTNDKYGGYYRLEAEFYDKQYASRDRRDLEFFITYSREAQGRTLELGCGTGRVLVPTAVAGCEITGLDLSPYMLAKCREKLSRQPENVQKRVKLIEGNMIEFRTGEMYPLVTMPFRPFQHLLEVDEQKACLRCVNRHLVAGGILVLDLFNTYPPATYDPKYWAEQVIEGDFRLEDGRVFHRNSRIADFHRDRQYNDCEIIYYVTNTDGAQQRLVQSFPMRYFYRYEVQHLLELCGYKVITIFGDYNRSPYSNDSPEMIFIAAKI